MKDGVQTSVLRLGAPYQACTVSRHLNSAYQLGVAAGGGDAPLRPYRPRHLHAKENAESATRESEVSHTAATCGIIDHRTIAAGSHCPLPRIAARSTK